MTAFSNPSNLKPILTTTTMPGHHHSMMSLVSKLETRLEEECTEGLVGGTGRRRRLPLAATTSPRLVAS